MELDASPWGVGGIYEENGFVQRYFAEEITQDIADYLEVTIGSAESQQALEAFAILVALRLWSKYWRGRRVTLSIRSDSISALILMLRMKTSGKGAAKVAREVALDVAEDIYRPTIVQHLPGITNISADALSRLSKPGSTYVIPSFLAKTPRDNLEGIKIFRVRF